MWIRSGFALPYLPEAQRQNEVVRKVMIDAACAYAGDGYDVVLDGILGPWLLDAFRAECRKRDLGLSYVVLRPSLEVTLSRASQRESGAAGPGRPALPVLRGRPVGYRPTGLT
ncbi:hypothetical protein [Streptomyces sp. NPDC053069]|uniref:hypothetical protein n=1 Tax=Streptomyces sp. NPDC053069 TaxID=3365695 RepID=UPI0037D4F8EE